MVMKNVFEEFRTEKVLSLMYYSYFVIECSLRQISPLTDPSLEVDALSLKYLQKEIAFNNRLIS